MKTLNLLWAVVLLSVALGSGNDAAWAGDARAMRVAVMDFTNGAGDDLNALGKGLQAMLTTDLAGVEGFDLVERARLKDIEKELALGASGAVDAKTAAKIGKLAGASHLVAGAFTVVGPAMRLDARLFAVDSGKVLLTAKVEGDKEAFFELEKALVNKLIAGVGVKLKPKERARIGRVHTADFGAFRKFSEGIDLFDKARYDEARKALADASGLDEGFELARVTLAEYEGLIQKAKARAGAARTAEEELARLKEDETSRREAAVVERLFEITGGKRRASALDRQVARNILVQIYTQHFHGWDFLERLEKTGDAFALERTGENMVASYHAGAQELMGKLSPFGGYVGAPPASLEVFDAAFAEARERMTRSPDGWLGSSLQGAVRTRARQLHLDRHEELDMLEAFTRYGLEHSKDERRQARWMEELAEDLQGVGELDRSTRWLTKLSASTEDSKILEEVAKMLEFNRDLAELSTTGPLKEYRAEFLRNAISRPMHHPIKTARTVFVGKTLSQKAADELERGRRLPSYANEYTLLGDEPLWVQQGRDRAVTGARHDRYRTDALRWFQRAEERRDDVPLLGVLGAAPRADFEAKLEAGFEMAPEWLAARSKYEMEHVEAAREARPRVGYLFGLVDIQTPAERNRETRKYEIPRPMHGFGVFVDDGELVLAELRETDREGGRPPAKTLETTPIEKWSLGKVGSRLPLTVTVKGQKVEIRAGRKRVEARLPRAAAGFHGVLFEGPGYAELSGLSVK